MARRDRRSSANPLKSALPMKARTIAAGSDQVEGDIDALLSTARGLARRS